MRKTLICLSATLALSLVAAPAFAKGCLKGAFVGGAVGHYAGHHGYLGAAAGCAIGHHRAGRVVEDRLPPWRPRQRCQQEIQADTVQQKENAQGANRGGERAPAVREFAHPAGRVT